MIKLVRTNSDNTDFINLVKELDAYLRITDGDEHDFYNQFNAIHNLKNVVVAYLNKQAVGCGAFKELSKTDVEVKRMFTRLNTRGKGIASAVLKELECWAQELNYKSIVLETGIRQTEAVQFYRKNNYTTIPNYGPYLGVKNSLCFKKTLSNNENQI
ncbi:MAG: GNAT family N-acetyltransferase [Winogradskyella sp.]|uniref:GNAT family N-acetyltransferase n=1 Tax=Winogradskyella sp. TaxID=1883156 RepID=UPI0017D0E18F|nr:GNAT family N-acetyltransferase [Winogradskyella sp.]